jgi:hypothetical protein
VIPAITAVEVASRRPSSATRPMDWNTCRTKPSSERMFCHASVRIRYVTKNGAMMKRSSRFFQRPPRKAIQYVSGYEMSSAASVAIPAYSSERKNCSRYWLNALE